VLFREYKWWLADQLTKMYQEKCRLHNTRSFPLIKENPYLMLALLCIS
jgi:hypothetical protein